LKFSMKPDGSGLRRDHKFQISDSLRVYYKSDSYACPTYGRALTRIATYACLRVSVRLIIAAHRTAHIHRRSQAAADENLHLDAAILLSPFASGVISYGYCLAVPERKYNPPQRDLMLLCKVANYGIGAALAQTVVEACRAIG